MKIAEINNINPQTRISHKGGLAYLNNINPMARYLDTYFNKAAKVSTNRIEPLSSKLTGNVNVIRMKNISAWDINPSDSKEYIFFLHGISQNVSNNQHLYEAAINKNKGVFAVEYRGYGINNEAKISEDKLKQDVKLAYKYLTENKGIKPENITIIGHSMGGALAADLASKHNDVKSLILISPLCKMSYLGKKFIQSKTLGPGVPPKIQNLTDKIKLLKTLLDFRFNSINKIKKTQVPTYILQSKNDTVTTFSGTKHLIETAKRSGILQGFMYFQSGGHKVDSKKVEAISDILDKIYS